MAHSLDTFSATNALIGSMGVHAPMASPSRRLPMADLRQSLRTAQVELYCAHDSVALHVLRRAQHDMAEFLPPSSPQLVALEAALWHVRRHEMDAAQQAIAFLSDQLGTLND